MSRRIRVEIESRNEFWHNALGVEWEHQFPDRRLEKVGKHAYVIDEDWLEDLQKVASQVFSRVLLSPDDPGRRRWFRSLIPGGDRE
ncbi:MAG TPA: hypothetical protein VFD58_17690 [Blastocatellia bacterium]|nr:hypothetical protein [Blastocatellia bacterium]